MQQTQQQQQTAALVRQLQKQLSSKYPCITEQMAPRRLKTSRQNTSWCLRKICTVFLRYRFHLHFSPGWLFFCWGSIWFKCFPPALEKPRSFFEFRDVFSCFHLNPEMLLCIWETLAELQVPFFIKPEGSEKNLADALKCADEGGAVAPQSLIWRSASTETVTLLATAPSCPS